MALTTFVSTVTGAGSWVTPTGVWKIEYVEQWGGGSGGGYVTVASGRAAGGPGGAYVRNSDFVTYPGSAFNFFVGSGGLGTSASSGATGRGGGDTWWLDVNSYLAKGATQGGTFSSTGLASGIATNVAQSIGQVRFAGGAGGVANANQTAGGGGSAASSGGTGGSATNPTAGTATAGASAPGGGAGGAIGTAGTSDAKGGGGGGGALSGVGGAGGAPGGGGGGAVFPATASGAGETGKIIVTYDADPTTTFRIEHLLLESIVSAPADVRVGQVGLEVLMSYGSGAAPAQRRRRSTTVVI